jgi:hypothetical protein
MSNSVCLTARQQRFYNYILKYHKDNGFFPNPCQMSRDMKCNPGVASATYGTLLLKGAFTNGNPHTVSHHRKHNTTKVQPLNIAEIKVEVKAKPKAKKVQKSQVTKQQIAALLMRLLGEDTVNAEILSGLMA